ncbi:hypothetical protein ACLK1T_07565 [Escherichia coli]
MPYFSAVVENLAALPLHNNNLVKPFILCFIATVTLVNACSYCLAMSTTTAKITMVKNHRCSCISAGQFWLAL